MRPLEHPRRCGACDPPCRIDLVDMAESADAISWRVWIAAAQSNLQRTRNGIAFGKAIKRSVRTILGKYRSDVGIACGVARRHVEKWVADRPRKICERGPARDGASLTRSFGHRSKGPHWSSTDALDADFVGGHSRRFRVESVDLDPEHIAFRADFLRRLCRARCF
jgi:hypothetical protein